MMATLAKQGARPAGMALVSSVCKGESKTQPAPLSVFIGAIKWSAKNETATRRYPIKERLYVD